MLRWMVKGSLFFFGFKDIERDEPKGYKYIYSLCDA